MLSSCGFLPAARIAAAEIKLQIMVGAVRSVFELRVRLRPHPEWMRWQFNKFNKSSVRALSVIKFCLNLGLNSYR